MRARAKKQEKTSKKTGSKNLGLWKTFQANKKCPPEGDDWPPKFRGAAPPLSAASPQNFDPPGGWLRPPPARSVRFAHYPGGTPHPVTVNQEEKEISKTMGGARGVGNSGLSTRRAAKRQA